MSLEIKNLSFSYGDKEILKNISFACNTGSLTCLLGCNGAGKTTLFRCILGLNQGYKGDVLMDNTSTAQMSPRALARKSAYIPQSHHPAFNYGVLEIVLMGLTSYLGWRGKPSAAHEQEAYEALKQMGIEGLFNKKYGEISGGEQQMVLISRALAQRSKILIMDEPSANLDFGNQLRLMEKAGELAEKGYLLLMSIHHPQQARSFADRVLVLNKGCLVSDGNPKEIVTEELMSMLYNIPIELIRKY